MKLLSSLIFFKILTLTLSGSPSGCQNDFWPCLYPSPNPACDDSLWPITEPYQCLSNQIELHMRPKLTSCNGNFELTISASGEIELLDVSTGFIGRKFDNFDCVIFICVDQNDFSLLTCDQKYYKMFDIEFFKVGDDGILTFAQNDGWLNHPSHPGMVQVNTETSIDSFPSLDG